MAIYERSLGPLYFTRVDTTEIRPPIHRAGLTEMNEPWRKGIGVVIPYCPFRAVVVGWWRRTKAVEGDLDEERWLSPRWLPNTVDEIASWGVDEEALEAAET